MPHAIAVVDADGRVARVNRQAESLSGYSREELVGVAVEELVDTAASVVALLDLGRETRTIDAADGAQLSPGTRMPLAGSLSARVVDCQSAFVGGGGGRILGEPAAAMG